MDESKTILIKEWLVKAASDLRSAKVLAEQAPPLLDTALFHCQQCAEKALKGTLTYLDLSVEKTHDLVALLGRLESGHREFCLFRTNAQILTPYAIMSRYPFGLPPPDKSDYKTAYDAAMAIFRFVLNFLPESTHPNIDE